MRSTGQIPDSVGSPPVISVLSAVYNEEQHIEEMIRSVQAQSSSDWELIVVDDDSKDSTLQIVKSMAVSDHRIRVVSGLGKLKKVGAFNRAFAESRGRYLVLLGGDDTLPQDSLALRIETLEGLPPGLNAAFFRLRTQSHDPRQDGMVIPRRERGNRSGGTVVLSRELAERVFPIPESLVAEDIWMKEMIQIHADTIVEDPRIVLNYRIHSGNSNPRGESFEKMTESIHARMKPFVEIPERAPDLDGATLERLRTQWRLEELRYTGQLLKILKLRGAKPVDRLRALGLAHPRLFAVRARFFKFFSGWS